MKWLVIAGAAWFALAVTPDWLIVKILVVSGCLLLVSGLWLALWAMWHANDHLVAPPPQRRQGSRRRHHDWYDYDEGD